MGCRQRATIKPALRIIRTVTNTLGKCFLENNAYLRPSFTRYLGWSHKHRVYHKNTFFRKSVTKRVNMSIVLLLQYNDVLRFLEKLYKGGEL